MKQKTARGIGITVIVILMTVLIGYYLYSVTVQNVPPTENLPRLVLVFLGLCASLGKLLTASGSRGLRFYEKAYEQELGRAFEKDPGARAKLLKGIRLYDEAEQDSTKYEKAIKALAKLLDRARSPEDISPVLLFIALSYTDGGLPGEAIKVYEDLLRYDPRNGRVHSNLGVLYLHEGCYEAAREHFSCAVDYRPDYYSFLNRGNLYLRTEEYDLALADGHKALELKNNGREAADLLTILYAIRGDGENQKKYRRIAITAGTDPASLDAAVEDYLH